MDVFGIHLDLAKILSIILKIGLIFIVYVIALPAGKKIIAKSIQKLAHSKKVSKGRIKTLDKLLANVYAYVISFVLILMLFTTIGVDIGPLILGAGVLGLAVAFGAQGLVSDVVTGFFILVENQLEIDDYVTTAGYDGIVEEIGLRTTKIRSFDGTLNYVPNRYIESVANHSRGNMRALVDIEIGYNVDIDRAIAILEQICRKFQADQRFKDGPHAIGVESFESTNIVLRIVGQTENGQQWACEREIRKEILEMFDKENIEIPFPLPLQVDMRKNIDQ